MHESKVDGSGLVITERQSKSFWSRVDRIENGCWLWKGGVRSDGYGLVTIYLAEQSRASGEAKHKAVLAHRLSWFLTRGAWPVEFNADGSRGELLHSCDVRNCVNPGHLRLGSHRENAADMKERGRASKGADHYSQKNPEWLAHGERNARAKLTEEQVIGIRTKFVGIRGQLSRLSEEYGVPISAIHLIVNNRVWKHLPPCEHAGKMHSREITPEVMRAEFEKKVEKGLSDCHLWKGSIAANGTPIFHLDGKVYTAARVAWALAYGDLPATQLVRRICPNLLCVNPEHLTIKDEVDTGAKAIPLGLIGERPLARKLSGEWAPKAKLTADEVATLRAEYAAAPRSPADPSKPVRGTATALAQKYGVTKMTIADIVTGRTWSQA